MANIGKARIEFYWEQHYSSYVEAKEGGGLCTITHEHMDGMLSLRKGIVSDIVEHVMLGVRTVNGDASIVFFLFDYDGVLIDAITR